MADAQNGAKTIGIIGGLGPAATVDLFDKIVRKTPATTDQEHLHILIDNNPRIPNRNDAIEGKGPSPAPHLAESARRLERAGAEAIVMACNTAHYFQPEIEAAINVPFLSMVDATIDETLKLRPTCVGVLAADGAARAGIYQRGFAARGVEPLMLPEEGQRAFMALVYRVKSGDRGAAVRDGMLAHANSLIARGAEAIVAACTEVPLVLGAEDLPAPFVSSTDALVRRTLAFALGSNLGA